MDTTTATSLTDAIGEGTQHNDVRAYRIRRGAGIDGLELVTRPRAALGPRDVRVRMRAVALNYRDLMVAQR